MIEPVIGFVLETFAQRRDSKHHPSGFYYSGFYPHRALFATSGPGTIYSMRVTLIDATEATDADYWAWWSSEDQTLKFIWASKAQVSMCFPYGPDAETARGRGRIVRVRVEEVQKQHESR